MERKKVFEPEVLNFFTFFGPLLSIFSVFRNLTSIPLHLSGFLDTLLGNLFEFTPELAFFHLMARTPATLLSSWLHRPYLFLNSELSLSPSLLSSWLHRAYPFLNSQFPLSLSLIIMVTQGLSFSELSTFSL